MAPLPSRVPCCARCGYDLKGVTGSLCPECGWALGTVIPWSRDGRVPYWLVLTFVLLPAVAAAAMVGLDRMSLEALRSPAAWLSRQMGLLGCSTMAVLIGLHVAAAAGLAWWGSVRHAGERAVFAVMLLLPLDLGAVAVFAFYFMLQQG